MKGEGNTDYVLKNKHIKNDNSVVASTDEEVNIPAKKKKKKITQKDGKEYEGVFKTGTDEEENISPMKRKKKKTHKEKNKELKESLNGMNENTQDDLFEINDCSKIISTKETNSKFKDANSIRSIRDEELIITSDDEGSDNGKVNETCNLSVSIIDQLSGMQSGVRSALYFAPNTDTNSIFHTKNMTEVQTNMETSFGSECEIDSGDQSGFGFSFDMLNTDENTDVSNNVDENSSEDEVSGNESSSQSVDRDNKTDSDNIDLDTDSDNDNLDHNDNVEKSMDVDIVLNQTDLHQASNRKPFKIIDNTLKHALSEEARIKSLEKRNKETLKHKELVKNALKNIDGSTSACANHVVFSDMESENENEKDNVSNEFKVTKEANLWSDSDDNDVEMGKTKKEHVKKKVSDLLFLYFEHIA